MTKSDAQNPFCFVLAGCLLGIGLVVALQWPHAQTPLKVPLGRVWRIKPGDIAMLRFALLNCPSNMTVLLSAGEYFLGDTLHIPNGSHLVGGGINTVLSFPLLDEDGHNLRIE